MFCYIKTTKAEYSLYLLISCSLCFSWGSQLLIVKHPLSLWPNMIKTLSTHAHTHTRTIFHKTNLPQSTFCLVAAVCKWDFEDRGVCLQLIHDTEWTSWRWLLQLEGKTKPVLLFMLAVFLFTSSLNMTHGWLWPSSHASGRAPTQLCDRENMESADTKHISAAKQKPAITLTLDIQYITWHLLAYVLADIPDVQFFPFICRTDFTLIQPSDFYLTAS